MTQIKNQELKPEFAERMQELLQEDFQEYLNILKIPPVRSIRCNTLKISPDELKNRLEQKSWIIKQPWKNYPEVMIIEGKRECAISSEAIGNRRSAIQGSLKETSGFLLPGELGRELEHLLGYYYIQELASMLPIIALQPKPNETFLDLCASPGSKTTQAAALMQNTGTIIANEISMGRLKILASNLEKCGVTNTIITRKEGNACCIRLEKQGFKFDKILVDAPCSGEGTLRSTPKTYSMWSINTVKKLSKIQKQLVESAFELLNINGEMIYSTCTHAPEENEEIVNHLLEKFKDKIEIQEINLPINSRKGLTKWKDNQYIKKVELSCRIYPQDNNTEGFFISKFRRIK